MTNHLLSLLLLGTLGAVACGAGSSDATTKPNNAPPSTPPASSPTPPPPTSPAPPPVQSPTRSSVPQRGRGPAGGEVFPGPRAVAAPDDSEVTVALARDLVKTRTFKSHATLAKVEEITDGSNINHKTIKVYLKSGEVKEIPTTKIGDPMTVPAATIVSAIGK